MPYDGVPSDELAARLGVPTCLSLVKVTSTLDIIHELARDGAPGGALVLADEQVAGRGRQGKRWHSPPGAGIWLGYLLRPESAIGPGVTALRVGLAVAASLTELGTCAGIKWPNDILLVDRKLGGVLCEGEWMGGRLRWIAVGVGLNVHGPLPKELMGRAIALDEVVPDASRLRVLEALVPRLNGLSVEPELTDEERRAFGRYDCLRGKRLRAPLVGWARGIGADGSLLVETEAGVEQIVGGSIVVA